MSTDNAAAKPVVRYDVTRGVRFLQREGNKAVGALVIVLDHPNIAEGRPAQTSPVLSIYPNGVFETMNSIYTPHVPGVEHAD